MNHEDATMQYIILIFFIPEKTITGCLDSSALAFARQDYNYNVSHFSGGDPTHRLSKAGFHLQMPC